MTKILLYYSHVIAGWSSLVARWAHNPKVAGSNPAPATTEEGSTSVDPFLFWGGYVLRIYYKITGRPLFYRLD